MSFIRHTNSKYRRWLSSSKAGYIYFELIFLGISKVFLPLTKNLINGEVIGIIETEKKIIENLKINWLVGINIPIGM